MIGLLKPLVAALASLRLTLAAILSAGGLAVSGEILDYPFGAAIAVPFGVLFVNLLAALATSPKLRRQAGLLGFHLSLATLAGLVAADRLIFLNGHVEVTEGTPFDAHLVEANSGPLHPWSLDEVRFLQQSFDIRYGPAMKRRDTRSRVLVPDRSGGWAARTVGDDRALVVGDYRFYTSFNKGFAPLLTYVDATGAVHRGSVHLPSYPLNHFRQGIEWRLPDGSASLKLWLHIPQAVFEERQAWIFRKPAEAILVVIGERGRRELKPGESLVLGQGRLRYEELRSWMGYTIAYNPLTPWMLAAVAIGIACFGWHVWQKTLRLPWQSPACKGVSGNAR